MSNENDSLRATTERKAYSFSNASKPTDLNRARAEARANANLTLDQYRRDLTWWFESTVQTPLLAVADSALAVAATYKARLKPTPPRTA